LTGHRIIMAPLEGVTIKTFRSCFYDHFPGLSESLTPFLPVPDRVIRVPERAVHQVARPGTVPVPEIPQLLLSESGSFLRACATLEKCGFTEVNWNLGCPSRGVVRKSKGAGLMPETKIILDILDQVLSRTSLKVSVKLRLGMENREELFRLLPYLKQLPLHNLILHPRLGNQMYTGQVDLDGFEQALRIYEQKICYNGDIRTLEDYLRLKTRFPEVEEWMIGRGLLADPFLLNRILSYESRSAASAPVISPHPFRNSEYHDFLDDLVVRLKSEFHKEISLWNYMKGLLSYTFSLEGTPGEMKNELRRLKDSHDWKKLSKKMRACTGQ